MYFEELNMELTLDEEMAWRDRLVTALEMVSDKELHGCLEFAVKNTFKTIRPEERITAYNLDMEMDSYMLVLNGTSTLNHHRIASMIISEPYEFLKCFYAFANSRKSRESGSMWSKLYEILHECHDEFVNGNKHMVLGRDLAGKWAENDSDYEKVFFETPTDEVRAKLKSDSGIKVFVLLDRENVAIDIFTTSDLKRLVTGTKISNCYTKRDLIRYGEKTHMQQIYTRLCENNEPRIRQVIIDRENGKFMGIVTIGEAYKWRDKDSDDIN
jgi:hypothetical protein